MRPRVVVVCNALEDATRSEREIVTDSPAASRKVLQLGQALRLAAVDAWVLSLGRGASGGRWRFYGWKLTRVGRVGVLYAPYCSVPGLSELLSLLCLPWGLWRLRRRSPRAAVFYNRVTAYFLALLAATALGFRAVLDLEDGEVEVRADRWRHWPRRLVINAYDRLCTGGALLASSALGPWTRATPQLCYYGIACGEPRATNWRNQTVQVLMSGSLASATGGQLLIECIETMRRSDEPWLRQLRFEVTGKGECLADFERLSAEHGFPAVRVHGRLDDLAYRAILATSHVGLALKPNQGQLASTTFPSKVIEFAASGLLVLTTDISDVRALLGESALYLEDDQLPTLLGLFRRLPAERDRFAAMSEEARGRVERLCAPHDAGLRVRRLIFGAES